MPLKVFNRAIRDKKSFACHSLLQLGRCTFVATKVKRAGGCGGRLKAVGGRPKGEGDKSKYQKAKRQRRGIADWGRDGLKEWGEVGVC